MLVRLLAHLLRTMLFRLLLIDVVVVLQMLLVTLLCLSPIPVHPPTHSKRRVLHHLRKSLVDLCLCQSSRGRLELGVVLCLLEALIASDCLRALSNGLVFLGLFRLVTHDCCWMYIMQSGNNKSECQSRLNHSLKRLNQSLSSRSLEEVVPALAYSAKLMRQYMENPETSLSTNQDYLNKYAQIYAQIQDRISQSRDKVKPQILLIFSEIPSLKTEQSIHQEKESSDSTLPNRDERTEDIIDKLYCEVVDLYEAHNLDGAMEKVNKLKEFTNLEPNSQREKIVRKVEAEYKKMIWLYSEWVGNDDWTLDKQENNTRLEYRVFEEEKMLCIRIAGQVQLAVLPFLAIAAEIDFHKEFVPFVYLSKEVKQIARNKKVGYSLNYVPVLSDRECYFWATGYDRLQHKGSVFIFTETYDQNLQAQQEYDLKVPPAQESDYVRVKVPYFCLEYTPITPTRARLRMWTKADVKLGILPIIFVCKAARIFSFDYFKNMVEKAKGYEGSEWQRRVEAKPEMYHFFQQKIEQYFQ